MHNTVFISLLCLLAAACQWFEADESKLVVARVNDSRLYRAQLKGIVAEGSSPEDSIKITRAYIESWIREELLLAEANEKLSDRKTSFEQKLEDYRRSLLIYTLEEEVMAAGLDTVVDPQLIETYFELNKEQFALREPIAKARFVQIDKTAPKIDQLRKLLTARKERESKQLLDYCLQYATQFHLNDSNWFYAGDIFRFLPDSLQTNLKSNLTGQLQTLENEQYLYLIYIRDQKQVGELPPLALEKNNIRDLILLQRRQQSVSRYTDALYQKAEREKKFEIFP